MTTRIKDGKRMAIIAEFIKTGKSPDGFKVIEIKENKYRVQKIKNEREALEAKKERLQKKLDEINKQLETKEEKKEEVKEED